MLLASNFASTAPNRYGMSEFSIDWVPSLYPSCLMPYFDAVTESALKRHRGAAAGKKGRLFDGMCLPLDVASAAVKTSRSLTSVE